MEFAAVVLENELLRATFLPELGGRLVSLFDKRDGRELLSRNPVFQPANLAIRNAWFSGGIEWNVGHLGHACHTASSVFAARVLASGDADEDMLRLYDFERQTGLFWQVDFRLPSGSPLLYASVRVVNPLDRESPLYWWTNIAVPEAEGVRVLAPASHALYIDPTDYSGHRFGWSLLPRLPSVGGADATYPLNSSFANEFFFQCEEAAMPWEAAIDREGRGFFECSTHPLSYRKLFCWGSHGGGRHWQEFLSEPGIAYLEIQGGLAPSQLHGATIAAGSAISWTQCFGALELGAQRAERAHGDDWPDAIAACEDAILGLMGPRDLAAVHRGNAVAFEMPVADILHSGSGWGALEAARLGTEAAESGSPSRLPRGLSFPDSTLGPEQEPWLSLLYAHRLSEPSPDELPGAFMTSPEWSRLLERSLDLPHGAHWYALYQAGGAHLEAFDEAGAEDAWARSIAEKPSAWSMRNLAVLASRRGKAQSALELWRAAWRMEVEAAKRGRREPCRALAEELLAALLDSRSAVEALSLVASLPQEIREADRVRILTARAELALGHLDEVEKTLAHEFATIREGENDLTDLWFELEAHKLATARGLAVDDEFRAEARKRQPPSRIDFRMCGRDIEPEP
jgi:hypothetical protein